MVSLAYNAGNGRVFPNSANNHVMQPSPRVDLGQWLPFPSDRLITTVIRLKSALPLRMFCAHTMLVACPNCEHLVQDDEADSGFLDGFEEHRNIWIKDYAIRCPGCRVVIAKTDSNAPDRCEDWDFHRIADLGEVTEVKPKEFDGILARIQRYRSMHAELDKMLSSLRKGEVVYRFRIPQDQTALAVCCKAGVIQTFSTLVSV